MLDLDRAPDPPTNDAPPTATAPPARARQEKAPIEPFQIKGAAFRMIGLRVLDLASKDFVPRLAETVKQAPSFFSQAPIVIDLTHTEFAPDDLAGLIGELRGLGLHPVAVQGGSQEVIAAALEAGLGVIPPGRTRADTPTLETTADEPIRATTLITEPVRSGRQVYAAKGDLIVLAPVSAGAEILAEGNIHVYDSLRGRALAGLNGDRGARIFCQRLEAELVSIAGLYKVSEDIEPGLWKTRAQIYLHAERLCIARMS